MNPIIFSDPETRFRYLNDVQAAALLGLKPQTLRNWRGQSKGPPYRKIGRAIRYDFNELIAFMDERTVRPEG
jgi:predicted DNA-binding transcriptional regulator AlpA